MKAQIMLVLLFCLPVLGFTGCAAKMGKHIEGNGVLRLDGDADYVEVPDSHSLDLQAMMTVEMWVKVDSLVSGSVDILLNKEDAYECGVAVAYIEHADQNFVFSISINGIWAPKTMGTSSTLDPEDGGELLEESGVGTRSGWYDGKERLEFGQWYHVAITYDGESANAYVNGKLTASYPVDGLIDSRDSVLRIGGRTKFPTFFQGQLDEIRVWEIARTSQEIQSTMYTTLTGNEKGLVGYWNFDDGSTSDKTTHSNHGSLVGDARIIQAAIPVSVP